jgi:mono/diheme cytochrome c family protein
LLLVRRRRGDQGLEAHSLVTLVLLVFTVLALWNGRITHTPEAQARNPIPRTVESVEIGRQVYLEHCAVCHGEDARGDGELVGQLERPPADLNASHMDSHPAGDIAYWIRYGIEPAMPGLRTELTDDEVWHLVNYLRDLRHPVDESS